MGIWFFLSTEADDDDDDDDDIEGGKMKKKTVCIFDQAYVGIINNEDSKLFCHSTERPKIVYYTGRRVVKTLKLESNHNLAQIQ